MLGNLPHWPPNLPLDVVSEALMLAPNPRTRELMELLLGKVLESHKKEVS
jgi:hypothetical protein